LVTNDWHLSPVRMLELYRAKDGLDKRFEVAKQDLKVRPLYVHSDERIRAMLLINMIALFTYSLLERQLCRSDLALTTRCIIERLEDLTVIETYCWDGSVSYRLTPVDNEQARLLVALAAILADSVVPHGLPALPGTSERTAQGLLPPSLTGLS
jgi:hypothetical protein